jgi:hypothetical protein
MHVLRKVTASGCTAGASARCSAKPIRTPFRTVRAVHRRNFSCASKNSSNDDHRYIGVQLLCRETFGYLSSAIEACPVSLLPRAVECVRAAVWESVVPVGLRSRRLVSLLVRRHRSMPFRSISNPTPPCAGSSPHPRKPRRTQAMETCGSRQTASWVPCCSPSE